MPSPTVTPLRPLPALSLSPSLVSVPPGGTGGGGISAPPIGISISAPVQGQSNPYFASTASALESEGCSWYDIFCLGKSQILRLVLLLLGLLCIWGAIYLYKPTNQLIARPIMRGARGLAEGMAEA